MNQLRLLLLRLDQLHAEIEAEKCQHEQHQEDRPGEDVEAVEVYRLVEIGLDAVRQDVADHQRRARVAVAAHVERHEAEEDDGVEDRKSVVKGKRVSVRVDLGGRRNIKKKTKDHKDNENSNL